MICVAKGSARMKMYREDLDKIRNE